MWTWKILSVLMLGLVGWVGMTMALTPTPSPSSTPVWIDMTPTHAFFQSTTTADMVTEILTRAEFWSGPKWQEREHQAVFEAKYTTSETPAQILRLFQNAFDTGDWMIGGMPQSFAWDTGFEGAVGVYYTTFFCYLNGHGTLRLGMEHPSNGLTNVSLLAYFPSQHYTCGEVNPEAQIFLPSLTDIPALFPPDGVTMISKERDDVYETREDSMLFQSDLPLAEIVPSYHAQLVTAGWQLVVEQVSPTAAMSTWSIIDETGAVWTGIMVFTADAEPDYYRAYIAVEPRP